ncbi:MAG: sensor histidine kinase [Chloroflexota bacterium]|nr:MAG: PAS domain-containing sensor histidine kinase [Chloroflexota bacterium]
MSPSDKSAALPYQDLFRQFADKTEQGILVVGSRRIVLACNPAAKSLLSPEEDVPSSLNRVVRDIDVAFAVGDAFHDRRVVQYESYAPHPDRLLRYTMIPVIAATGEPSYVVVTIDDVTRLRHLETVRRDFVANVSHELRTPITSINLLVETLQTGAMRDAGVASHFLQRIEVETLSMMRLVEVLLELSRLESGRLALQLDATDVGEVFGAVSNRLDPAAKDKGLHVRLVIDPGLPPVQADSERLEQVLMNLVHNAIKFTPEGGEVTLRAARQGRSVVLEIVDTGVGMDPHEAARIFERFYKVDKGRNRAEGTGLGLAVARHLVELHGSRLTVVSEPGRGARFSFALPLMQ